MNVGASVGRNDHCASSIHGLRFSMVRFSLDRQRGFRESAVSIDGDVAAEVRYDVVKGHVVDADEEIGDKVRKGNDERQRIDGIES